LHQVFKISSRSIDSFSLVNFFI